MRTHVVQGVPAASDPLVIVRFGIRYVLSAQGIDYVAAFHCCARPALNSRDSRYCDAGARRVSARMHAARNRMQGSELLARVTYRQYTIVTYTVCARRAR